MDDYDAWIAAETAVADQEIDWGDDAVTQFLNQPDIRELYIEFRRKDLRWEDKVWDYLDAQNDKDRDDFERSQEAA